MASYTFYSGVFHKPVNEWQGIVNNKDERKIFKVSSDIYCIYKSRQRQQSSLGPAVHRSSLNWILQLVFKWSVIITPET